MAKRKEPTIPSNTPLRIAAKFTESKKTVDRLVRRIGCNVEHLHDGSLCCVGTKDNHLLVTQKLKAGSVPVAAKFFVPVTTSRELSTTE